MAITRKPKAADSAERVNVEELINRGGSPGGKATEAAGATTPVVLRIPTAMLQQIDTAVRARPVRVPRHTWMLEAMHEKLSREGS